MEAPMFQRPLPVLLLAVTLSGCQVAMPVAKLVPTTETEYATEIKSTIPAKVFPASVATPTKAANQGARGGQANRATTTGSAANGQAGAADGAGDASATDTARTPYLKIEATDASTPRLVPMLDDERKLTGVMTQPSSGELSWRLVSVNGPIKVGKWRVAYRSVAKYPELPAPTAETKGPPPLTPVGEEGTPVYAEVGPDALALPESFVVGKAQTLTWSLKNDFTREAVTANPRTAKLEMAVVPLDDSGQPMRGPDGKDIVIKSTIAVL
jgi:hypothetical protein